MDLVSDVLQNSLPTVEKYKSVTVEKHLDLEYDLGTLLASDNNDLDLAKKNRNDYFLNLTRENTQLLISKIWELPAEQVEEAIVAKLPPMKTILPRTKPLPKPKLLTKWQQFAKEKGIQKKKKNKLSWDEQLQQWIPLYGFKRTKVEKEKSWILEVPDNGDPMEDQFLKKVEAKSENVAKNELQRLRNIAKARKIRVPRVGIVNAEASSKDLQTAVTVAKTSTASLGKFQDKLPKEKEAGGVSDLLPGGTRKRKLPPTSADVEKKEHLVVVASILNKKPKIDIETAVARHIGSFGPSNDNSRTRTVKNSPGKIKNKSKRAKKPKGVKGQRKVNAGGRKRR